MEFTPTPTHVWKNVQVSTALDRAKSVVTRTLMVSGNASLSSVVCISVATMILSVIILVGIGPPMVTTRPTSEYERPTTAPMAVACWSVITATVVVGLRMMWN